MTRFVIIILLTSIVASCSSRVVYERQSITTVSPNAININTATLDDLERLPGIGRKIAEAIIAFREENGPFRRAEHLLLIRGISEKRFADIRQFISTK